jgi:hypothetical protein
MQVGKEWPRLSTARSGLWWNSNGSDFSAWDLGETREGEVRGCALTHDGRPLTPLGLPCPEALPVWAGGHCIVVGIHGREAKKAPAPVLRAKTAQGTCPSQIERQQLVGNLAEDRLEQFGELLVTQFGVTCIHIREKRIMGN